MASLSYQSSGVNRSAADRLVEKIAILSKKTWSNRSLSQRVKSGVGGYASLFELDRRRWLAASTDGVGTKLKLAFQLKEHRTVGIDLVAMSVNDLLCVGAEPLFFLDYFATGKLQTKVAEQVLQGIVQGCEEAGCALVGGETAEMPEFYSKGEYDLAGFAVGALNPKESLPKKSVQIGDSLIGIGSSGCHSNGFSWLRSLLPPGKKGQALARELLTPTRIYVQSVRPLLRKGILKGLAHITGSGFLNIPRISEKVSYEVQLPPIQDRPKIFEWVSRQTEMGFHELAQTLNLGIGMVAVVSPKDKARVLGSLKRAGEKAWNIGQVVRNQNGKSQVFIRDDSQSAILDY